MPKSATLERTVFETSRELEFFTEKELQMQLGHGRQWWPAALLKELIDNALDACETAGVAPDITVDVGTDGFSVRDNGPGIPAETLARSLDYMKRVSDKTFYVSPTRGQMGNALKTVWAAPFVADGERGHVDVWSQGLHHIIEIAVDRIAQKPAIEYDTQESDFVKNGTFVKIGWAESACLLRSRMDDFYNPIPTARDLVEGYAAFNPHATFRLGDVTFEATTPEWPKWKPDDPTSAHWYTAETLRDLIAAYVAGESENGHGRTVREFVSEFKGLSSTKKQKEVTADLSGMYLHDLVNGGDIDMRIVRTLLVSMREKSRAPKAPKLGVIEQEHLKNWMVRYAGVAEESVRYARRTGENDLPHIVEVAFGVSASDIAERRVVTGLNWSPTLKIPTLVLEGLLGEMRVDTHDPITIVVHLARPRFNFVDRGKTRLDL